MRNRIRKIAALATAGLVMGVGAVATLASWNTSEWVYAGLNADGSGDTDPGVGTSSFQIWQNRDRTAPTGNEAAGTSSAGWFSAESNPGGGLLFTAGRLALTPGDSVYAPVAIQTKANSTSGTLTLSSPVAAAGVASDDPLGLLWGALTYSVKVTSTQPSTECDASNWSGYGTAIATDAALGDTLTPGTQAISANRGNVQYYCFKITLPTAPTLPSGTPVNALQGLSVAPAWQFTATSN